MEAKDLRSDDCRVSYPDSGSAMKIAKKMIAEIFRSLCMEIVVCWGQPVFVTDGCRCSLTIHCIPQGRRRIRHVGTIFTGLAPGPEVEGIPWALHDSHGNVLAEGLTDRRGQFLLSIPPPPSGELPEPCRLIFLPEKLEELAKIPEAGKDPVPRIDSLDSSKMELPLDRPAFNLTGRSSSPAGAEGPPRAGLGGSQEAILRKPREESPFGIGREEIDEIRAQLYPENLRAVRGWLEARDQKLFECLSSQTGARSFTAQAIHLSTGFLHAELAAMHFKKWSGRKGHALPGEFVASALKCAGAYLAAWPLSAKLNMPRPAWNAVRERSRIEKALQVLVEKHELKGQGYLILRRLLRHLLKEAVTPVFETSVRVLLWDPLHKVGMVKPVRISTYESPFEGLYLDPVELGMTVVAPSFLESLTKAWEYARRLSREQPLALEISPRMDLSRASGSGTEGPAGSGDPRSSPMGIGASTIAILEGESAGCLLACGMRASLEGKALSRYRTVLAALDPASPERIVRASDRLLSRKLAAAARSGIRRVYLAKAQEKEFRSQGDLGDLELVPVSGVSAVYEGLAGERSRGKLWEVPDLPEHHVQREEELRRLREDLLGLSVGPEAATGADRRTWGGSGMVVVLHGVAGTGKSVLAAAVARAVEVRQAFTDGVIWLSVGQEHAPALLQERLARALGEKAWSARDAAEGRIRLERLLSGKECLFILDDVRGAQQVESLGRLAPRSRMLITARDPGLNVKLGAIEHRLEALNDEQALALLSRVSDLALEDLPPDARDVARECENLPLALEIAGALVGAAGKEWREVLGSLRGSGLPRALAPIDVSVKALASDIRERFLDLAVFPEGAIVPAKALQIIWRPESSSLEETRKIMQILGKGHLARLDGKDRLRLHSLQAGYARSRCEDLSRLHGRLVEAYRRKCAGLWHLGPDDGYFYQHLAYHLHEAGLKSEARNLIFDLDWLQARLKATSIGELLGDFRSFADDEEVCLVEGALRLSVPALAEDKSQLGSQLLGRLLDREEPPIEGLLEETRRWQDRPRLLPLWQSLTPPWGEIPPAPAGQANKVTVVSIAPDSARVFSGYEDGAVKVWDSERGVGIRAIGGHESGVKILAITPDGTRAISGSDDGNIRIWELERGTEIRALRGHSDRIRAFAVAPEGARAVSGSDDGTLKVWDLKGGKEIHTLRGHGDRVGALAVAPEGARAVSGSDDGSLKVWDLERGKEICSLQGHTGWVRALAITPDGACVVSGSDDHTLKVWDLKGGNEIQPLGRHESQINALSITSDGSRVISGSADHTLKIWDLKRGKLLATFFGDSEFTACAVTPFERKVLAGEASGAVHFLELEEPRAPEAWPPRERFERQLEGSLKWALGLIHHKWGAALMPMVDSEDILQEAFFEAYRHFISGKEVVPLDEKNFYPWLSNIIERTIRRQNRLIGSAQKIVRELPLVRNLEEQGEAPDDDLLKRERLEKIEKALARLSPREQEAIKLVYLQGLRASEAAKRLGHTPSSLRVLLHRALVKLGMKVKREGLSGAEAEPEGKKRPRPRRHPES